MSWRIRKSINLGGGMRINLSKSGPSFSFGRRGARVTVGKRGVTRSFGFPGTGIYNTKTTGWSKKSKPRSGSSRKTASPNASPRISASSPSGPEYVHQTYFFDITPPGAGKFFLLFYLPIILGIVFVAVGIAEWPFLFLALALLVFALVNYFSNRKVINAYHILSKASQASHSGNMRQAYALVHSVADVLPGNPTVRAYLGAEASDDGNIEEARSIFSQLPAIYKQDPRIAELLAASSVTVTPDSPSSAPADIAFPNSIPLPLSSAPAPISSVPELETTPLRWYQRTVWIILLLIFFFPAGVILMFKFKRGWPSAAKAAATSVFGLWFIFCVLLVGIGSSSPAASSSSSVPVASISSKSSTPPSSSSAVPAAAVSAAPKPSSSSAAPASSSNSPSSSASSAASQPSSSAASVPIKLVSVTNPAYKGEYAKITVRGKPNTQYGIMVEYDSGASKATGLDPKNSDSSGLVSWAWKIGTRTKSTGATVTIIGDGSDNFSTDISIQ